MNRLILIPARSGSTRVQSKNLKPLLGKPLVAHIIGSACRVPECRVVVTTNSSEISEAARTAGAEIPFLRPEGLSQATSNSVGAIVHALRWFDESEHWRPEYIAFCPPTNPFIEPLSIQRMFERLAARPDRNSIVTVTTPSTHPFRIVRQLSDSTIQNGAVTIDGKNINDIERTQDWPQVWEGSPACRMTRTKYFFELAAGRSPEQITGKTYDVRSSLGYEISRFEATDIDDEHDFVVAEAVAQCLRRQI